MSIFMSALLVFVVLAVLGTWFIYTHSEPYISKHKNDK